MYLRKKSSTHTAFHLLNSENQNIAAQLRKLYNIKRISLFFQFPRAYDLSEKVLY